MRRYERHEKEALAKRYAAGEGAVTLAAEAGVHWRTLRRWVAEAGVPWRYRQQRAPRENPKYALVVRLYRAGHPQGYICQQAHICDRTYHLWTDPLPARPEWKPPSITWKQWDTLKAAWREGYTYKELERQFGYASTTLGNWIARAGLKGGN